MFGRRLGRRVKSDKLAPKVLALVAAGQSYRQIGRQLDLSENTVLEILKTTPSYVLTDPVCPYMVRTALLVNPPHTGSYRSAIMRGDSLALATIGQFLSDREWRSSTIDSCLNRWSVQEALAHTPERFDAVCVTLMHESAWSAAKHIAHTLRRSSPTATFVVGGAATTLNPNRFTEPGSDFDYVYAGASLAILHKLLTKPRHCSERPEVVASGLVGPDDLGPVIHRPDLEDSFAVDKIVCIESSKGCYARCTFCSIAADYEQLWFAKSPNTVLAEVDAILYRLPSCSELRFVDANFFGVPLRNSDYRAFQIADGLAARGIRFRVEGRATDVRYDFFSALFDMGMTGIFIGLESGLNHVLRSLKKGCTIEHNLRAIDILRTIGCSYSIGFMMITSDTTTEDIYENVAFLSKLQYGIRWKHLFSGLIYQQGTKLNGRTITSLDANRKLESRLGYVPQGDLARKLLLIWNAFCLSHRDFLAKEHAVGIALERGKEARSAAIWELDAKFSLACLSRYRELLAELRSTPIAKLEAECTAARCAEDMVSVCDDILLSLRLVGLDGSVMIEDIRSFFSPPCGGEDSHRFVEDSAPT